MKYMKKTVGTSLKPSMITKHPQQKSLLIAQHQPNQKQKPSNTTIPTIPFVGAIP